MIERIQAVPGVRAATNSGYMLIFAPPRLQDAERASPLKKGNAELLILSLVEARPRHGYDIIKLIEARSDASLHHRVASLYPLLYRLEKRGWIEGWWVEKDGERRRYYRLTPEGEKALATQESVAPAAAACLLELALTATSVSLAARGATYLRLGRLGEAERDFARCRELGGSLTPQIEGLWREMKERSRK